MATGLPHFDKLMGEVFGPSKPKVRKCRHGSYYTEGHTPEGEEILRCARCSGLFRYDGVRKVRITREEIA